MKQKSFFVKNNRVAILALFCCFLWGSAFPAIKLSYLELNLNGPFEMIQLAGCRFFLAGLLVLFFSFFCMKIRILPTKKEWVIIFSASILQTFCAYACNYIGISNTTSAKTSILSSSEIFFTVILSHIFLKNEKIDLKKIMGLIIGTIGIISINTINDKGIEWSFSFFGEGFVLLTSLFISISLILIKKTSNRINLLRVNGWQLVLGGISLALFGFGGDPHIIGFTWKAVILLVYMALLSAAAFSIWFFLLQSNPATEVTIYKLALPVFGAILSVLVLEDEQFTWALGIGLVLVVIGIIIANLPKKHYIKDSFSKKIFETSLPKNTDKLKSGG